MSETLKVANELRYLEISLIYAADLYFANGSKSSYHCPFFRLYLGRASRRANPLNSLKECKVTAIVLTLMLVIETKVTSVEATFCHLAFEDHLHSTISILYGL